MEFYSNSRLSSTYFSKSEFKFELSILIIYEFKFELSILIIYEFKFEFHKISFFEFEFRQMNTQNRDNFFTAGAHALKKEKIFRNCSRFKIIP